MRTVLTTLAVALAFTFAGCKAKQPAARKLTAPTTEEADAFGKEFAKKLSPCESSALDSMMDTELLIARAVAHRSLGRTEVKGLSRGLGSLGDRLCTELAQQGVKAKHLRTQVVDGTPRPLVRLVFDEGLNYYQLELDKRDNVVRAADIYIFLAGEKLSETFQRVLDVLLKSPGTPIPTATIQAMKQDMHSGEWEAAQRKLESLPAAIRASKPVMLVELQIASELGDEKYVAVMDKYAKAYPNDPSLALVQIDRTLLKKQYAEALVVLDQLDKQVGGDPYLDVLRVDAYMSLGKPDEAIKVAKRGAAAEPDLEQMWWALLSAQAAQGQFAEAIPTVETLRDKFGVDLTALGGDDRFTKLAESDVYRKWAAGASGEH
jgi:tetratricopeptide (TPR) repeat protein